ncbi:DUF2071 domain-containing protein [Pseudogracilibacillus sp. SE30717A]|uniref:DUF2071 domain-containing protein n=1 Tax=Pseudogracilibacillus sp. SE30717A TaxID=3098293 RepID=UPI00300E517F
MRISKRKYPWIGEQTWTDTLFLHWPVPVDIIRQYVPSSFEIDTFKGTAWISIVVFNAKKSLIRGMPAFTSFPTVTQINMRTYVYHPDCSERGVYFISLRVNNLLAAIGAQKLFGLPFYRVTNIFKQINSTFFVTSWTEEINKFSLQYTPEDITINDKLAQFLTERYCIWNIHRNQMIKIPIRHSHWNLRKVQVKVLENKLLPFTNESNFIAHYCGYKHALLYPYETYNWK